MRPSFFCYLHHAALKVFPSEVPLHWVLSAPVVQSVDFIHPGHYTDRKTDRQAGRQADRHDGLL